MNDRDWGFALGELGDPLADIKEWMIPPYPAWLPKEIRTGQGQLRGNEYDTETEAQAEEEPPVARTGDNQTGTSDQ